MGLNIVEIQQDAVLIFIIGLFLLLEYDYQVKKIGQKAARERMLFEAAVSGSGFILSNLFGMLIALLIGTAVFVLAVCIKLYRVYHPKK